VFAPFYFFNAGTPLRPGDFSLQAVLLGLGLLVVCVPIRVLLVLAHRRAAFKQPLRAGLPVAIALTPTLVFSLVLAEILRDRFDAAPWLVGALIVYTVGNTLLPGFVLKRATAELDVMDPTSESDAVVEGGTGRAPEVAVPPSVVGATAGRHP
jgi:Kef-type K+ transport system membrane component KefB